MDFQFTPEQEMLRTAAREFAENEVAPRVAEMEKTGRFPMELIKPMGEAGFFGVTIPVEYGGLGLGYVARLILLEEIGRVSAALAMALQVFHLGVEPIVAFGSEEQKRRLLPPLARGERLATVAVTEAGGGSDPSSTKTVARFEQRSEGDGYVLDGRKVFITNAHLADVQVVLTKTKDEPKEFTAFIVERGMAGFKPGREEHKLGLLGCDTGEVIFEGCFVPVANRLGNEGDGLKTALKAISEAGRSGMAGVSLGLLRACVETAGAYAAKREVSGRPLNRYQGIQWKLADLVTDRDAATLLSYRACWLKDQGKRCDVEMATAKYFASEAAIRAAKLAAEVLGGYGYMEEFATQRYLRDAQLMIPSAGTSDVMRMVIARAATP